MPPFCFFRYRLDGKPKVIRNESSRQIVAEGQFEPLVDLNRHDELIRTLDARSGVQRGKPRSRDPNRNPLGGRVIDWDCGWPMYRTPKDDSYAYSCAAYMQTHGARCAHNKVDGPTATGITLDFIRQKVLSPAAMDKLKARLHELAAAEKRSEGPELDLVTKRTDLRRLKEQLETVKSNMALANSREQYAAISGIFDDLNSKLQKQEAELRSIEQEKRTPQDSDSEVEAAMAALARLPQLVSDRSDLSAATEAFNLVNARLFLKYEPVRLQKRIVNRVRHGKLTLGAEEPPVKIYEGPTGRQALKDTKTAAVAVGAGGINTLSRPM